MSELSDARASIAKKAIINANGGTVKAHALAEKYYSEFAGRIPTMNEVHDLMGLVDKYTSEIKEVQTKVIFERYKSING